MITKNMVFFFAVALSLFITKMSDYQNISIYEKSKYNAIYLNWTR